MFHLKKPDIPINESERLKALSEYRILGTKPEENYDDITKIASLTCGTPIALLSLVDSDRQWFKAKVGIEAQETVRDWSFCAHAIHSSEPLIVEDALQDERFFDNPLVKGEPKIRLYAGFPLQNDENHRIGTGHSALLIESHMDLAIHNLASWNPSVATRHDMTMCSQPFPRSTWFRGET